MFSEIPISTLNDFVFCPRSIYFHGVYDMFDGMHYKSVFQKRGTLKHSASDEGRYSSRKRYLQGMDVASQEYGLVGKIDIYDQETKTLIERKAHIEHVYEGYKWQVFGQIVCLEEMGFEVMEAMLHSLSDNKKYPVEITQEDWEKFFDLLEEIRMYDMENAPMATNKEKCERCIYRTLCKGD